MKGCCVVDDDDCGGRHDGDDDGGFDGRGMKGCSAGLEGCGCLVAVWSAHL